MKDLYFFFYSSNGSKEKVTDFNGPNFGTTAITDEIQMQAPSVGSNKQKLKLYIFEKENFNIK